MKSWLVRPWLNCFSWGQTLLRRVECSPVFRNDSFSPARSEGGFLRYLLWGPAELLEVKLTKVGPPWGFYLSDLLTLSLRQFIIYSSGFPGSQLGLFSWRQGVHLLHPSTIMLGVWGNFSFLCGPCWMCHSGSVSPLWGWTRVWIPDSVTRCLVCPGLRSFLGCGTFSAKTNTVLRKLGQFGTQFWFHCLYQHLSSNSG